MKKLISMLFIIGVSTHLNAQNSVITSEINAMEDAVVDAI